MAEVCDQIYANGVCDRQNCPYSHDVQMCRACREVFESDAAYQKHLGTQKHVRRTVQEQKRRTRISIPILCTVCTVELPGALHYPLHTEGRRHRKCMEEQGLVTDPGPEEIEVPRSCTRCDVCTTNIPDKFWERHVRGSRHALANKFSALQGALDQSETDKNGMVVSPDNIDFGIIDPPATLAAWRMDVTVENTNTTAVKLIEARLFSQMSTRKVPAVFELESPRAGKVMKPAEELLFNVVFRPKENRGRYEDRLEFVFYDPQLSKRFAVTRSITAILGVKDDYEQLKPSRPYVRPKRSAQVDEPIAEITPGVPPPSINEFKWAVRLLPYEIPKALAKILEDSDRDNLPPSKVSARIRSAFLQSGFNADTYARYFANLLWVEEERAKRDLSQYDMVNEGATLEPHHHVFYKLEVAGLAEKRPSIIVTDRIFVKNFGSAKNHWFEGHVHQVLENHVVLRFHGSFNSFKGQRYHVRFALNRLVYRRMHQGLNTAFTESRVLFPDATHIQNLRRPKQAVMDGLSLTDRKIGDNPPQLEAVAAIVRRPPGSVPFIVFGPPGTGKTVTIVEAIRQLVQTEPNTRIIACAPSNSAADLIADRLAGLGKSQIIRLNAHSRGVENVPSAVRALSREEKDSDGFTRFTVPSVEQLKKFRVVVCTCLSASLPYGIGLPRGHFSHIFIDEAGQATEPEVMISIKTMADPNTNVVLSGDCKQLGPIVRSPVARDLGLAQSYLDRLMANEIYNEETGKGTTIMKLVKNWRSHPSILKFPNEEFYKGDLVACGDPTVTHSLVRWEQLPKQNFPVMFHGVAGKDEREASSPSFFNIAEASEVKYYINALLEERKLRIRPEHIGVISPYHAQVQKIRKLLKNKEIKVGSVEEYQGQEKRIIIISTVRSSMEFVHFDLRHTLGFVANPRRFNVAVTRAQALLIVIGDPKVLSLDPLWRSFINYIHVNNGCKGTPIDWDPLEDVDRTARYDSMRREEAISAMSDLISRTREEILAHTEDIGEHEADVLEGNVEQPWREEE